MMFALQTGGYWILLETDFFPSFAERERDLGAEKEVKTKLWHYGRLYSTVLLFVWRSDFHYKFRGGSW